MKIELKLNMDNAAFEDDARPIETARILRELADYIEGCWGDFLHDEGAGLMDINGNRVGKVVLSGTEE